MNITQVQYVLAIAEQGSMSKAAERLFVSQPALSLQIKKLEQELGFPLFIRSAQGVSLTPQGREFCERARHVQEAWSELLNLSKLLGQRTQEHLRIRLGPRVFSNELFPKIVSFFDQHSEIEPTFIVADDGNFLKDLTCCDIDLALSYLPSTELLPDAKRFFSCELIRESQCILASHESALAGLESIALEQLRNHTMITAPENSMEAQLLQKTLQQHGIIPARMYRVDGVDTTMELVRTGKGIVLGPRSFASYYGVCAVPLIPESEESLSFICLQENRSRPEIKTFRKYLQNICASPSASRTWPLHL